MRHKLKAVFDDRSKAQQALAELLGSGYPSADTALVTVPGPVAGTAGEQSPPLWRERPGASTARLLSRFFDHADRNPVVAASRPGSPDSYILTLSTDSASEAQRAATLISGFMHIDSEDAGTPPSGRQPDIAHAGYHRAIAPGALQYYARDTRHYFGTRASEDTSTIGTTFQEPMLPAGYWPGTPIDGPAMQGVHTSPPVGDDAASAAYRFGHDLHENDMYRNRSWQEAHADLKVLWEASDPDRANWETSEPAVHLGWDSTRPEIEAALHQGWDHAKT